MIFKNSKVYDACKWIASVALPALLTCYGAIAKIWGIPYTVEILGTGVAIVACLDTLLGISSINFKKQEEK